MSANKGGRPATGKTAVRRFRCPPELWAHVVTLAEHRGCTASEVIRAGILREVTHAVIMGEVP